MMPNPIAGVNAAIGNMKPVTLVRIVMARKSKVSSGLNCEFSIW